MELPLKKSDYSLLLSNHSVYLLMNKIRKNSHQNNKINKIIKRYIASNQEQFTLIETFFFYLKNDCFCVFRKLEKFFTTEAKFFLQQIHFLPGKRDIHSNNNISFFHFHLCILCGSKHHKLIKIETKKMKNFFILLSVVQFF